MSHMGSRLGVYFHSYETGSINIWREQVFSKNMLVVLGSNVKHDSAVEFPNPNPWMENYGTETFQVD